MKQEKRANWKIDRLITFTLVFSVFWAIVSMGLSQLEQRNKDFSLRIFADQARIILNEMTLNSDVEIFWSRSLYSIFRKCEDHEQFAAELKSLRKATGEKLNSIIWDQKGNIVVNSHFDTNKVSNSRLKQLFVDLKTVYHIGKRYPREILQRIRELIGPQLPMGKLASNMYYEHLSFLRADSAGNFADFWVKVGKNYSAMVFFNRDSLITDAGLRHYLANFNNPEIRIDYFAETSAKDAVTQRLQTFTHMLLGSGKFAAIKDETLIAGKQVSGGKLIIVRKQYQPIVKPGKLTLLLALSSIFILLILYRNYSSGFRLNQYSVKWQLLPMLAISTGLPLLTLSLLASDHISRKRGILIKNAYQKCVNFIQNIDQRSLVIHANLINRANNSIADLKQNLPEKFGQPSLANKLKKHFKKTFQDIRLVSSYPALLMTDSGILEGDSFKNFNKKKHHKEKEFLIELKMFRNITSYYLSVLNNRPLEMERFAETELLAEMVYQRPFHEILQNLMLGTDKILPLGWGEKPYPLLVKLISLKNNKFFDYFFTIFFDSNQMQHEFLLKQNDNLERNPENLKFTFANNRLYSKESKSIDKDPWFKEIYHTTRKHPALEPCFTQIDGKEHIYAGIQCQNLDLFYLYAFYPLEKIEKEIQSERSFLLSAALIGIFMLVGMAMVFSSSFVIPLSSLRAGAIAIRNRDFSFRIPPQANDEFGEMAKIFNDSISDFEELSLAGMVQSRLFPSEGIFGDGIDVYGKSIPMVELGGDYFDYFPAGQDHLVVLAGDVAGHGVGASLIMAMAKAGVMCCRDILDNPAEILRQLHQIIHESRTTRQRKVMTFQYLYIEKETGKAVYANAGACSPILVDSKKASASELTLNAPVLGGFKKSKFSNKNFRLDSGQALIFYTDGIIEACNSQGREVGYEKFKEELLLCYDCNPKSYYDNIYNFYRDWLGDTSPQDDLTLIVLVKK